MRRGMWRGKRQGLRSTAAESNCVPLPLAFRSANRMPCTSGKLRSARMAARCCVSKAAIGYQLCKPTRTMSLTSGSKGGLRLRTNVVVPSSRETQWRRDCVPQCPSGFRPPARPPQVRDGEWRLEGVDAGPRKYLND